MSSTPARETYRHGDLRQALVEAGLDMAREGGPDAVVLREATRRAGVSPNAAYRHFADRRALLVAVSNTAQSAVADAMWRGYSAVDESGDPAAVAKARLRGVGLGYIRFAREQPGLFRAAIGVPDDLANSGSPAKAGVNGLTSFQILGRVLDELVVAGAMPADRRPNAELFAWSAVHGLGMLVIDGPLRGLTDQMIDGASERLIDMVERGL
ncbi:MAG: TetR/AcrR family transcriptional regulator [Rhodoglobus sp.]